MKRQKHSLSYYKLLTCDLGQLVPIGLTEVLPGDTVQHSTSLLLRCSPLIAPVMHPVSVRVHHFFMPHRLSYSGWADFITGGPTGTGSAVPFPTNAAAVNPAQGSLLDHLGVPTGNSLPIGAFSLLPVRAYNAIYNEFFRDEDLVTPVGQDDFTLKRIAWEKDYFTTARPFTQKGPNVTLPLGTSAPVITNATQPSMRRLGQPGDTARNVQGVTTTANNGSTLFAQTGLGTGAVGTFDSMWANTGMQTDLTGATAASINQLRLALALQRYQEARAQYGSRFTEYLRYLGVKSADQRLDRPEYLGGGKQTISFSEVLRTASDTAASPVGDLKGHGIAALRSNRYRYFCEEHGYIMTLLSVRPRTMYINGIPRHYLKRTKEDFWQKELEQIGQQTCTNAELFMNGTATDSQTFGFQDRYAEYRHNWSQVSGDFKSTLNFWHMARSFGALPVLNQAFTDCDPGKRNFAVQTNNVLWIMANHNMVARRLVGKKTIGRII